jgi:N-acetylmuramoyl-L-alanine amidase
VKTVLVQAGHIAPREPGFESGTGTAGEQELVRAIRDRLCTILKNDGRFKPLPMPGRIPRGTKCDAALFLHADGSSNKTASGFSFGYPDYPINRRLALQLADEFTKLPGHPPHHADNYTADLRGYYGFSRVDTRGPEVLIEHGFLTNPKEAAWLRGRVNDLAQAEYRALLRYFGMVAPPKPKPKPPPKPKLSGYWLVTKTYYDGHTVTAKTGALRLWTLKQGNLAKKGIRDVRAHWVETG